MFCKLSNGGVMHEGIQESRKRDLETKRENRYPLTINLEAKGDTPPRGARQSGGLGDRHDAPSRELASHLGTCN